MNQKSLSDKNKDLIFSKLTSMANMPEHAHLKDSNFKKLTENYKTSLKQLQKGNNDFLQKFNTLYSNARYSELSEYLDKLEDKPKKQKIKSKAKPEPKKKVKAT